jgi:alpha-N-arabinofuranosidase
MNLFKKNTFIIFCLVILSVANAQERKQFTNPILPGFHPDPSICRVGNDYYLATSSFEFWSGIPVFHSTDLVNWQQVGHCITRKSQADLTNVASSDGLWAPTLRYNKGKFYMVVSSVQRSPWKCTNFYVTAEKPEGPWSEPIIVEQNTGIDPDLFFDDNGKCYYARNDHNGILAAEIDIATGRLLTPFHLLWAGTGAPYPEAPHIYKKDGWYYLLIAEGGTGAYHRATIARSKSVFGEYEAYPQNPILNHTNRFMHPIQCTGHGDFVQAQDGSWWFVFLAKRSLAFESFNSVLGRETFLSPAEWKENEWPVIGNNGTVEMKMKAPAFFQDKIMDEDFNDDFSSGKLGLDWNYLRNPVEENYSLKTNPGYLSLRGTELNLNDLKSPTFIGVRQKHFNCTVITTIIFKPNAENEEAGLTVYAENKRHYDIALTKRGTQNIIALKAYLGSISGQPVEKVVKSEKIQLCVKATETMYKFYFSEEGKPFEFLGEFEAKYLESPQYTGAYFGLFATGNGYECSQMALFDNFIYSTSTSK